MADAPVCHVPVDTGVTTQPSGVQNPSIPIATDLNSAIAAINAMRLVIQRLGNQQPRRDGGRNQGGRGGTTSSKTPPKQLGRWNEVNRVTQKVKITNPQDPEQFVEVLRINKLTFQDSITGEQWIWSR